MSKWSVRGRAALLAALSIVMTALGGMVGAGCNGRIPNFISKDQEIDLGKQYSAQVEQQNRIITSGPQAERLQRVAARITPLARADYDVPYSVKLIDSKEINAFAIPGGPIYFYRGLMDLAGSDDEVASVLGHEATHIVKQHSVKQMSDALGKETIASLLLGNANQTAHAVAGTLLQLQSLQFSRGDEAEADKQGFRYLVKAGYNPYAMADFFRKMEKAAGSSGGTPEWLQSHPLTSKRIEQAQERADTYTKTGKLP
jgi:predicted Zn-dependent protease